MQSIKI